MNENKIWHLAIERSQSSANNESPFVVTQCGCYKQGFNYRNIVV